MDVMKALAKRNDRLIGRKIRKKEANRLREVLGTLVPEWFVEMQQVYPLIGCYMTLSKKKDQSGEGVAMDWMEPDQIIGETLEMQPGVAAAKAGYLPVGILQGLSDPYFLQTRGGDDPPLVRISHEAVDSEGSLVGSGVAIVCDRLSDFFKQAKY